MAGSDATPGTLYRGSQDHAARRALVFVHMYADMAVRSIRYVLQLEG